MAEQAGLSKEEFTKLSHKQKKALFRKLKRKEKRQTEAQAKEELIKKEEEEKQKSPSYATRLAEDAKEEELLRLQIEAESRRQHELWVWSEEVSAERLRQKKEQEEKDRLLKLEIERKIKEEWEERQKKEKEEEDERKKKKEKQDALLKEARANENKDDGPWHNPIASVLHGKERQVESCPFFTKVGACRFGDRCSRLHDYPDSSTTLLLPNMYSNFELEQGLCEEFDTDIILEYEEGELYTKFREFYEDVLPEFKSVGRVTMFKVSCNYEPHLRGNVYVQYSREENALAAFFKFNARWYGGKQMSCQFINIPSWRSAICGLHIKGTCPKGRTCNFLHVFKNPNNEFWEAERGYNTPAHHDRSIRSYRGSRRRSRSPRRHRSRSKSPRKRRSRSHSRSRSKRKRRSRSDSESPERSRHGNRTKGHRRSRSRSRDRHSSRSSRRESVKSRERSDEKDRSISRSRDINHQSNTKLSPKYSREKPPEKHKHRSKSTSQSPEHSIQQNRTISVDNEDLHHSKEVRLEKTLTNEQNQSLENYNVGITSDRTINNVTTVPGDNGMDSGRNEEEATRFEPQVPSPPMRSRSRSVSSSKSSEDSRKHKKHKSKKKHKKHKHRS